MKYDVSFTPPVLYWSTERLIEFAPSSPSCLGEYLSGPLSTSIRQGVEYDIGSDEPVSIAVVRAVSAAEGREPRSLPPLANVFDTDALNALFGPGSGEARE